MVAPILIAQSPKADVVLLPALGSILGKRR
jgi:hypothetical protein